MFEMFVLLINEINPHCFCFVTCFLFIFTSEALSHGGLLHTIFYIAYLRICCGNLSREFVVAICRRNLPWEFAVEICRGYLPWEFASEICRGNLPQKFAMRICCGYLPWVFCIRKRVLFCTCEQILFMWKQTFFICQQNFLICETFFINSVSFCYCRGSYGPP